MTSLKFKNKNIPKLYKCKGCKKFYRNKQRYEKHTSKCCYGKDNNYRKTSECFETSDSKQPNVDVLLRENDDTMQKITDTKKNCETETETEIKAFKCPNCDKTFSQKGNMHTHMIKKHNMDKPSTRIDRNNVRKTYSQQHTRFSIKEDTSNTKPKRFSIHDDNADKQRVLIHIGYLSKRNAETYISNLNIIYGLFHNIEDTSFQKQWSSLDIAIQSLKEDRPNQTKIIDNCYDFIQTTLKSGFFK